MLRLAFVTATLALLGGCDMLGIDSPERIAAAREADGKAVGGACRHAGRAIEDCYALNKRADRAAVFAGWRDMNDYMRENKIDSVTPQLVGVTAKPVAAAEEVIEPAAEKRGAKGADGAKAKPKARES